MEREGVIEGDRGRDAERERGRERERGCSDCQCDETQPSTGKGLALRVGHRGPYSDV